MWNSPLGIHKQYYSTNLGAYYDGEKQLRDLHFHWQVRTARHGHDKLPFTLVDKSNNTRLENFYKEGERLSIFVRTDLTNGI